MKPAGSKTGPGGLKMVLRNVLKTGLSLLAASLICEGLYHFGFGEQNIIIVMVLSVFLVAAITDGYVYGLAASLVGVFVYDFLVTQPRLGFSFTLGFPITLSIMLLVTLTTSTVTARIKKRARDAHEKELRAELLYEVNRKLLSSRDEGAIARHALEYLVSHLHRSVVLYTVLDDTENPAFYFRQAEGDVDADFFMAQKQRDAARLAARRREATGTGTVLCHDSGACYIPLVSLGAVNGVLGISCRAGPLAPDRQPFVELIVDQTGQALHVQALTRRQQRAEVMAETEKNRNSFLRGISHDLRTPLTSIIGASATFLENRQELAPATQTQLMAGIHADAQWLLSMVENILSVTRIHQSGMVIVKREEAAEEIVGEAVALFRRRYPGARIAINPPDELLLVPMDALLVTQVLNNLLDNTQRHAGGDSAAVVIEVCGRGGFAEFTVTDDGPGVDEAMLPHLFEIRPAHPGHGIDASRGLGIGLSICKSIVQAHGGWISAQNLPGKGARFLFALPMEGDGEHGEQADDSGG